MSLLTRRRWLAGSCFCCKDNNVLSLPVQWFVLVLPEPQHHEHGIVSVHGRYVAGQQRLLRQHPLYGGNWNWKIYDTKAINKLQ